MALARTHTAHHELSLRSAACWTTLGLAGCFSAAEWVQSSASLPNGLLAPILVSALLLSNFISLPVGAKARIWLFNIPVLLIAALFPPPVAMVLVGMGIGAKEILVCRRCANTAAQAAGQTGRWMFLAFFGAVVAHLGGVLITGVLLCPLLWLGDVLTAPLVVSFGSLSATVKRLLTQTWEDELMQYMTAYFMLPFFVNQDGQWLLPALSVFLNAAWIGLYTALRRGAAASV